MFGHLPIFWRYVVVLACLPILFVQTIRLAFSTRQADESITSALSTSILGMYMNATLYANGTFDYLQLSLVEPKLEV